MKTPLEAAKERSKGRWLVLREASKQRDFRRATAAEESRLREENLYKKAFVGKVVQDIKYDPEGATSLTFVFDDRIITFSVDGDDCTTLTINTIPELALE